MEKIRVEDEGKKRGNREMNREEKLELEIVGECGMEESGKRIRQSGDERIGCKWNRRRKTRMYDG